MTQFCDLSIKEIETIERLGNDFYKLNSSRVEKAAKGFEYSVAPSGSDLFRPELWKGSHWNWFFYMYSVKRIKKDTLLSKLIKCLKVYFN